MTNQHNYKGIKDRLDELGVKDTGLLSICGDVYGKTQVDAYHFNNALNVAVALHNGDVTQDQVREAIKSRVPAEVNHG